MDARRRLIVCIEEGSSVAQAARAFGVSRQTASLWWNRFLEVGHESLCERSRAPGRRPRLTRPDIQARVLELAGEYPFWGPQKLWKLLEQEMGPAVCERTVARILSRAGRRVAQPGRKTCAWVRFERAEPNQLWQADFKKVGPRQARRLVFSLVDDSRRFCLALREVRDETLDSCWAPLWDSFGDFGLPDSVLTDNGSSFRSNATWRWSSFDLRLMLLGIWPSHGRPYHPQTQGKVERFHGTLERELDAAAPDFPAQLEAFRTRYNWVRPHQALLLETPGKLYRASDRKRPDKMPDPFFPEEAITRKVCDPGVISFRGERYKVGRAFIGLPVGILETAHDGPKLVWGNYVLANLEDLRA